MKDSLISVIVPVFNTEKYLADCLTSVIQNSHQNLEVILVDDGSSDGSGAVCDSFQKSDNRVTVFHQENHGVSAARNFGISQATGDYIAFIDSDDTIASNYFDVLVTEIEQCESDLSICPVQESDIPSQPENIPLRFALDFSQIDGQNRAHYHWLLEKYYLFGPYNKLFRRNIIIENHILFPEDTSYGEDLLFCYRYLECCRTITYSGETVYFYNHDNEYSLSHRYRKNRFENGLRLNSAIKDFSMERHLFDVDVREYWANRVFDDAYNSILQLFDPMCDLRVLQKIHEILAIFENEDYKSSLQYACTGNYGRIVSNLMRRKSGFILFCYLSLRKRNKESR